MAQKTKIEWADMSSNAIRAINIQNKKAFHFCTKIGIGCVNCYSEAMNIWVGNGLHYTKQNEDKVAFVIHTPELRKLMDLKSPQRIFMHDMTDIFHHKITDEQLDILFDVYDALTQHTLMFLTKRPKRMADYFSRRYPDQLPAHFWVGTSVSNQKDANENISPLLRIRARVRFLSAEPLLGEIDLTQVHAKPFNAELTFSGLLHDLRMIIIGGESGARARYCNPEWIRYLIDQVSGSKTEVFVKQLGTVYAKSNGLNHAKGGDWDEWPEDLRIRRFPK